MGKYGKIIIALLVAIGASAMFLSFNANPLSAQQAGGTQPNQEAEERKTLTPDDIPEIDIKKLAFKNDKNGCGLKASFFYAVSRQYEKGKAIEETAGFKAFAPIFEEVYDEIKEKGMEQASRNNLQSYSECMQNAPKSEIEEKEKKFESCQELNAVALDTLSAMEKRQKLETVLKRHERKEIDLSGTAFEDVHDPIPFFIGKMYETQNQKGMEGAIDLATAMTMGCVN